jgi:hypothetical protein
MTMRNDQAKLFEMFLRKWTFTQHPLYGIKSFPDYEYLLRLPEILWREKLVLLPKSRQMLISWTMCSEMLFRALEGGLHLLLSKNQFSADELLRRIGFIFDHLPQKLELKTVVRNRSELEIYRRGRIISLPATEDAPRMHSPTSVFWDEMAFTPNAGKIWIALKPCLDNGAYFTGVSTPNGASGIFAELVKNAPGNGFYVHRVHWKEHPERDAKWARQARKGLSEIEWRREYEISFEGSSDLVYPEFTGGNVLSRPYKFDSNLPVYRAIDFGYRHPFVLWLQETLDSKIVVFEEWAGVDATVEQMITFIRKVDSKYGIREAKVLWSACDPAGMAVDAGGISPIERLKSTGFKMRYRSSRILTGVEMVKSLLRDANGDTRLYLSPKIQKLAADLRTYRWRSDQEEPEKDGFCDHSLDALRYFAVNYLYAPKAQLLKPRVIGHSSLDTRRLTLDT